MPCTKAATGPCSINADSYGCNAPIPVSGAIPPVNTPFYQGTADGFIFTWVNNCYDALNPVEVLFREYGATGYPDPRRNQAFCLSQTQTVTGLVADTVYDVWARVIENSLSPTVASVWTHTQILTSTAWDSDADILYSGAEVIEHSGGVVIHSP